LFLYIYIYLYIQAYIYISNSGKANLNSQQALASVDHTPHFHALILNRAGFKKLYCFVHFAGFKWEKCIVRICIYIVH